MSLLPDQPQSIGRILDSGFRLYRRAFRAIVPLAMIGAAAAAAPSLIDLTSTATPLGETSLTGLIFVVLSMLVSVWIYASIIVQLDNTANDRTAGIGDVLGDGISRFFPALGATLLVILVIMIGMLLLIIPGVILMVSTSLALIAVVIEKQGPIDGINRSRQLIKENWWRCSGVMAAAGIAMLAIFFAVLAVVGIVTGAGMWSTMAGGEDISVLAMLIFVVVQTVLQALLYPAWYAIIYAMYRDLKLRKGGTDLKSRIESVTSA